jgi:Cys-tRNA(Pro)/Cys-tRNA(Cys) deacylase
MTPRAASLTHRCGCVSVLAMSLPSARLAPTATTATGRSTSLHARWLGRHTGRAPPTSTCLMAGRTRAIDILNRSHVRFTVHEYEARSSDLSYGEAAAEALGVRPDRVFKTLVAMVDGSPVVAVVPVSRRLSLKHLAKAAGGKRAEMADPATAERLTGYVVGGISPFGQRRHLPMFVDGSASVHETVYVSAGRRGVQVEVTSADLLAVTAAKSAEIAD